LRQQLAGLYAEVKKRAQQIFWLPPAPRLESDAEQFALVNAYAREAEKVFAGDEVYMVPFVYDNAEVVLFDFLRGNGKAFQLARSPRSVQITRTGRAILRGDVMG
jgi:hypothetical protein